jgi:hypothetical protein
MKIQDQVKLMVSDSNNDKANEISNIPPSSLHEEIDKMIEAEKETIFKLAGVPFEALREIDTHIRSTDNPIPHIVITLKNTLPEYQDDSKIK